MPKTKVLFVFGTRPEAIKLAPVIREVAQRVDVDHSVCVTAQHREMLDQVLDVFNIDPDYDLDLMTVAQSPSQVAASVLAQLEPVLDAEAPDWTVVQGDTTTTAAAAMGAFYRRNRVAHVEAGLRTGDRLQPFPEEINRRMVGAIANIHFPPTQRAKANLIREGVNGNAIRVTGNTAIDALHDVASRPPPIAANGLLESLGLGPDVRLVLVTAHRRENFGTPLDGICSAIRMLATSRSDIHIVLPVHPNPAVREPVTKSLAGLERVTLVDPLDYVSMIHVMKASHIIVTDSGGIQEEAPGLGKPVLVLRSVTERPEGVEAGVARLVGTEQRDIVAQVTLLLDDESEYSKMSSATNPYGDGHASRRIVDSLLGLRTDEFWADRPLPQSGLRTSSAPNSPYSRPT